MDMQALQCPFAPTHTHTRTLLVTVTAKYLRTLCVTMAIWRECSMEKGKGNMVISRPCRKTRSYSHADTHMNTCTCMHTHVHMYKHTHTCTLIYKDSHPLQDTKLSVFLCKVLRTLKNFYKCMHKSVPSIRTYTYVCDHTNGWQKAAPK